MTTSVPSICTAVARVTVAALRVRTPATGPTSDPYSVATARADAMPFDDGSSAACTAREFHMSS